MGAGKQTTLRRRVTLSGTGVHSGHPLSVSLSPSSANSGFVFVRSAPGERDREVRARHEAVATTEFATVLGDEAGPVVSTIEHVLAALHGLGVDNAVIEVDGPEVPIMDGSAAAFVEAIDEAGVVALPSSRRYLKILKPVGVVAGESYGEIRPYDAGFRVEVEIQFPHAVIGRQSLALDIEPTAFRRQLARARTFGFMCDVERLWKAGYALGASLENSLVLGEERVLNADGLRFRDEFVRHKALDIVGDMALAGLPILGAYRSIRGGHRLNHAVLCALMADRTAFAIVEPAEVVDEPVRAVRSRRGHGELRPAFAQATLAPDLS